MDVVRALGPVGVAVLMLAENVFPPLPSEIIMPLAGYLAARGEMSVWAAVAAGTVGSVLGALLWYEVGQRVGQERFRRWTERHGVWLTMRPEDVDRATEWFRRRGRLGVLLARLVPMVRTLISVPAGISAMPLLPFLLYTTLGTALWTGALTWAGLALGSRFTEVDRYVGPLSWAVVGVALVVYLVRVVRYRRAHPAP